MGNLGGHGIRTDQDVDPVAIVPKSPHLHAEQIAWLAQGLHDVFADFGLRALIVLLSLIRVRFILLLNCHHLERFIEGQGIRNVGRQSQCNRQPTR